MADKQPLSEVSAGRGHQLSGGHGNFSRNNYCRKLSVHRKTDVATSFPAATVNCRATTFGGSSLFIVKRRWDTTTTRHPAVFIGGSIGDNTVVHDQHEKSQDGANDWDILACAPEYFPRKLESSSVGKIQ